MRVCASLSSAGDMDLAEEADMVEIRLDLLGGVPDTHGKPTLVTFRGGVDLSVLPDGFSGMVDVGEDPRPDTGLRVVSSYHDYESTPTADEIVGMLSAMDGDIRKGAFMVNKMKDLMSILEASKRIREDHVLLGMGALGVLTRIRQDILGNEFTFGYVGEPTAPGQLSVPEMRRLGDGCTLLGILGCPLGKSRSPEMQNSALRDAGIRGIYVPLETDDLEGVEDVIRGYDIRGLNVTIPHKQGIMAHLDAVDPVAEEIGAVNTVVNDDGRLTGYNTDVDGITKALECAGIVPDGGRVLIMGSGGAARACAHFMRGRGCDVTVTGRNQTTGTDLAERFDARYRAPDSVAAMMYDLIVNCTPVGMYSDGPYPVGIGHLSAGQSVFDMVYGTDTPLMEAARKAGCRIANGKDMLAGQGAASFRRWTGADGSFDTMRRVLG